MLNVGRCTSGSSLSSILSRPMRCTTGTFAHFNLQCGTVLATRIYRGHMQGALDSRREVEVADSTCRCSSKIFVWSQSVPMFIGIIGAYFMRFSHYLLLIVEILFFMYSKHCHHHHHHLQVSLVLFIIVVFYIFDLIKLSIMMKLTLKMKPPTTIVLLYYCNIIINNKSVSLLCYHGILVLKCFYNY